MTRVDLGELRALASEHRGRGNEQTGRVLREAADEIDKWRRLIGWRVYGLPFADEKRRNTPVITRKRAELMRNAWKRSGWKGVSLVRVYRKAKP